MHAWVIFIKLWGRAVRSLRKFHKFSTCHSEHCNHNFYVKLSLTIDEKAYPLALKRIIYNEDNSTHNCHNFNCHYLTMFILFFPQLDSLVYTRKYCYWNCTMISHGRLLKWKIHSTAIAPWITINHNVKVLLYAWFSLIILRRCRYLRGFTRQIKVLVATSSNNSLLSHEMILILCFYDSF